jgi:hypothetical protein
MDAGLHVFRCKRTQKIEAHSSLPHKTLELQEHPGASARGSQKLALPQRNGAFCLLLEAIFFSTVELQPGAYSSGVAAKQEFRETVRRTRLGRALKARAREISPRYSLAKSCCCCWRPEPERQALSLSSLQLNFRLQLTGDAFLPH